MGYVKNAIAKVHDEGCIWIGEDSIRQIREEGLEPRTKHVVVEGFSSPVELDAIPKEEARRLLPLVTFELREEIQDALEELEEWNR